MLSRNTRGVQLIELSVIHVEYEWEYKFFSHLQTKVIIL